MRYLAASAVFLLWMIISALIIVALRRRKIQGDAPNEAEIRAASANLSVEDLERIECELRVNGFDVPLESARIVFAAFALMQKCSVVEVDIGKPVSDLVHSLAVVQIVMEFEELFGINIPDFDGSSKFAEGSILHFLEMAHER